MIKKQLVKINVKEEYQINENSNCNLRYSSLRRCLDKINYQERTKSLTKNVFIKHNVTGKSYQVVS